MNILDVMNYSEELGAHLVRVIVELERPEFYIVIGELEDHRGKVLIALNSHGETKEFPLKDVEEGNGCDWFEANMREDLKERYHEHMARIFRKAEKEADA